MPDVISITDKITELFHYPENVISFIIILLIVTGTIVALAEYKSKLWSYVTNPRNKWYITYSCFVAAMLILCYKKHWISGVWLWATAFLWLFVTIIIALDLRPLDLNSYHNLIFRRYRRYLCEGTADSHMGFFEKERKWILYGVFSSTDRIEYYYLKHCYRIAVGDYEGAYKALQSIKESTLYKAGQLTIRLRKAYCLAMMGSMNAALQLLGRYEDNQYKDPTVWIAYSFIFENSGDMDKAYEAASKAVALADTGSLTEWEKGGIYNDFSRAAIFHGNDSVALWYINLAWEKVKGIKDNRFIHIMGGNRVLRMAINGENRQTCDAALEEYRKHIIEPEAPMNQMQYMNVLLQYYRQFGDESNLYATIKNGFTEILPKLNPSQQIVFKASVFRVLMNGHFVREWFDKEVDMDLEAYKNLKLIDRLFVFREYIGIFMQEEFWAVTNKEPYRTLKRIILKYYQEDAVKEIDNEIEMTESYNIYKYKELMQHKLAILKYIQGKEHIEKSKDIYLQLAKQLYDAGLHIDSSNILMILLDECGSPYNVLIAVPFTAGWQYFSDFMNHLPLPPDPVLMPDGIHLEYYRLNIPLNIAVKPLKADIIADNIDGVIAEVKSWANHPAKYEYCVKLAHLLMCLERKAEAKDIFQIYEDSKISDSHYASWMVDDIAALRATLGTEKRLP